jgi:hypothetical protein
MAIQKQPLRNIPVLLVRASQFESLIFVGVCAPLDPPPHIANLVQTQISKLNGVFNTDTYVPLESIMKNQ